MAMRFNSNGGRVKEMLERIARATQPAVERAAARGVKKTVRLMVVGIPNVGKSTFINRLNGSAVAKASDRPGVTRAKQWVKLGPYLEMLDTPACCRPRPGRSEARAESGVFWAPCAIRSSTRRNFPERCCARLLELKPDLARARFKTAGDDRERRWRGAAAF